MMTSAPSSARALSSAAVSRIHSISVSAAMRGSSAQWKLDPRFSSERSAFCSAVV